METGHTEHGGLGFNAAHAPAQHAEAIDHGSMRIGADERIGKRVRLPSYGAIKTTLRQIFQVDLVDDTRVGRHDRKIVEAGCPQRRNA